MGEQKIEKQMGRPPIRTEPYKRTTIELPISLLEFLKAVKPNRTEWLVQAAQEKREREARQMLKIGARVRILKMDDEEPIYVGETGTLVDINPMADDGDAFGVHLDGSKEGSTIYFWAKELEVIGTN